ncbi:DUF1302 domain-containing protein [Ramlibacter sp. WS9]|uniref:DUF1302 domain-containing protein n=1 Tax=Ramlibacter sp. WS9 TaxID=1882741 RepID=UPI001142A9E2|nr:DUF1302 family protein [Ramlibacter sp. WS9]ROZ75077.1 DUF1302 family protein [Ramlibacter sp. WS9]
MPEHITPPRRFRLRKRRLSLVAAASLAAVSAGAVELDTGNEDWNLRWDNTVKASVRVRTEKPDPVLKDSFRLLVPGNPASAFPQALGLNAGDQNFQKRGIVSERFDLLSEFDGVWRKNYGLRVSASAWYDAKLHRRTQADNDPFIGQAPPDEFPADTRKLSGKKAEVLDAFVFGSWDTGNGTKLSARLGQHALLYGESLFFGDNGIARAQGPIDVDKLLASPNAQFKEIIRPVPQLSGQLQISPKVSIGGYYQFRAKEDRLPPSGSYFSIANIPWGASQPEFIPPNFVLLPGGDRKAKDSGQFGMQLKWRLEDTDLGFFAARYHDKGGQLYGTLNPTATPSAAGTLPGTWFYVFPENVKTVGASFTRSMGDFNFAGEASVRTNVPLRSTNMIYAPAFSPQPRLATGRTAHMNLSTLAVFGPNFLAKETSLVAEIAWNRLLKKDDPDAQLDAGRTRDATALQFIYTPTYRQVVSGLDLSVPVGVRYTVAGNSSVTAWDAKGSGSANIGVQGDYLGVWQFSATYTHFIGRAAPFADYSPLLTGGSVIYGHGNHLADRNNVALSVRRTF